MISLTLSTERVRNTVITNEQGQIIYKTYTPFRLVGSRTTTIQKIKPSDGQHHMQDQFDVLGEIEWHAFTSSKFRFRGTEVETKAFIPKRGLLGRKRVFTGPDGRPYRWDLKSKVVVLSRDDESRNEVARFHRATLGIIGRKKKATLEVSPEVVHMMDTIIMTFIYVEKLRKDKEDAAKRSAASGGP
ncbi:hypothetical protein EV702DRAFT_1093804 [Suillus placidus]|uniref:DUF6593 domain-containing protein n=1 Tax=Suillus placidus TaxID=48579 RepID=A0A9P7D492_9AGAM|nr:hypothetical protein EV702DRAFT_1093804 [Suillus placidus]